MNSLKKWQHYWSDKTVNYTIRILVSLLGIIVPCWYLGYNDEINLLALSIIASALAETDDSFFGRLRALALTFICFALASLSVGFLTPYPLLFGIGLFTSVWGFIMVGSIGPRYAGISFGSILIALYTMISGPIFDNNIWYLTFILILGTAWYYLVAMIWQMFWPMQPVQQNLAYVFKELAHDLEAKSRFFHPNFSPPNAEAVASNAMASNTITSNAVTSEAIQASRANSKTLEALNDCKEVLLNRSKRGQVDGPSDRFLQVYFIAQDIHERIHSTYYQHDLLSKHFNRSDTLFRLKHVLQQQAKSCREIARALRDGHQYEHSPETINAIEELRGSVKYLSDQQQPQWRASLTQLMALKNNFATIDRLLSNVNNPDAAKLTNHLSEEDPEDKSLHDTAAHTPKEMWKRIRANLTWESNLFRHGLRLATALTAGYIILNVFEIDHGYWVMISTVFVCQPNYNATQKKIISRIIWTMVGLVVGIPLLYIFPAVESHLLILVIVGTAFFALRANGHASAIAMMTVLAIICFNPNENGYELILPRLIDTIIGSILAFLAVRYILPNWGAKHIHKVMANSIQSNKNYFDQIIAQYRIGKNDTMSYRLARRNAHNSGASLSSAMSNILVEPNKYKQSIDESFRFLTLNHAMLSYLSALGTQRDRIDDHESHQLILEAHRYIRDHLEKIYQILETRSDISSISVIEVIECSSDTLEKGLTQWRDNEEVNMILQQLHLIYRMLPELYELTEHLTQSSPTAQIGTQN